MIVAPLRSATRLIAPRRTATPRNATRLWAAWNRFCGSGMPKGINCATHCTAPQRPASLRIAPQRNANLERNPL